MGERTVQIMPPMGCQSANIGTSAKQENNKYVLRSAARGKMRVHQALNAGRAMALCWTEKIASSARFASTAVAGGAARTESMDCGIQRLPRKQNA
jgi:hypothetical protein